MEMREPSASAALSAPPNIATIRNKAAPAANNDSLNDHIDHTNCNSHSDAVLLRFSDDNNNCSAGISSQEMDEETDTGDDERKKSGDYADCYFNKRKRVQNSQSTESFSFPCKTNSEKTLTSLSNMATKSSTIQANEVIDLCDDDDEEEIDENDNRTANELNINAGKKVKRVDKKSQSAGDKRRIQQAASTPDTAVISLVDENDNSKKSSNNDRNHHLHRQSSSFPSQHVTYAASVIAQTEQPSSSTAAASSYIALQEQHSTLLENYRQEERERLNISRAIAASNRDIKSEQDQEYYESLIKDREKELAKKEKQQLQKAIQESIKHSEKEEERVRLQNKQKYLQKLEPEPPESTLQLGVETISQFQMKASKIEEGDASNAIGAASSHVCDVTTVAFRLPSSCCKNRITRRFKKHAHADQLIGFLHTCDELSDVKSWTIREVLGGKEIHPDSSLVDLGLHPRGVVIVKDEKC